MTTRYVADFLGFGHLIKGDQNPKAPYSENQIYQHITNCQVFFSYNADETKLLNRRKAYRSSMNFLYDLTMNGNIWQANRWSITRDFIFMGKKESNPMVELGFKVAERVLEHERDAGRSAAILLLNALDSAYNSVLAVSLTKNDLAKHHHANTTLQFTSVLDHYIEGLYKLANRADETKLSEWLDVQQLAISDDAQSDRSLTKKVLEAQHVSVRLPILRRAIKDTDVKNAKGEVLLSIKKHQTVICDIVRTSVLFTMPLALTKSITELGKTKVPSSYQRRQLLKLPTKLHFQIRRVSPRTCRYHGSRIHN